MPHSSVRTPFRTAVRTGARPRPLDVAVVGITLVLLCLPMQLMGQQGTVTGTVTEMGTQRPLVNAQVVVQGTTIGSLTNARGQFSIPSVPSGEVNIRAELLGFAAQTRSVTLAPGETVSVDFSLRQTTLALDQIVVTGAGVATERRRLGNTIATIDMAGLQDAPVSSMSELLTGREPGVMGLVGGGVAGEGARLRIRGSSSLSQSNEPVVYVDGVRMDNSGGFGPGIGAGGGAPSRLDDLNPDAIERIEILKGAAAATLYGTQASNGVIQIFTKRGQSGAPRWDVSIEQGFSRFPTSSRMAPHAGFVRGVDPTATGFGRDLGVQGVRDFWGIDVQPFEVFEVDMIGRLFGTGHNQTYSIAVTGGSQAITYHVSGRFFRDDGPYRATEEFRSPGFSTANDEVTRVQLNANTEIFPRDDLRVRVSSSFTESNTEVPDTNNNIFGVLSSVINSRPEVANPDNLLGSPAFATTRENWLRRTLQEVQRFGGAVTAVYQPLPSLALDATFGIDFVNQRGTRIIPFGWNVDGFSGSNVLGQRVVNDRNHREITLDVKGTWSTTLGEDWTGEFLAGGQGFLTRTNSQRGTGSEFPGPGIDVAGGGALQTLFEGFVEEVNVGAMFQTQIGFRDYAFLTLGGRLDEHSAFGETAGTEFYPKASLSLVPSQLDRWNPDLVSTLRLRAAVGRSGLQPSAFDQFTTFAPLASFEGPGLAPSNLGNPFLTPETSTEWEVGSEVGLFQDRASLDVTYWNRTVNDVLVDRQFVPSGGFRQRQVANVGQMDAWGVEIGFNAVAVARPNFSANVFANAAFLRETITDLGEAPALKVGGSYPRYRQFTREGFHPGAFFGPLLDESVEIPVHLGNCVPLSRSELTTFLSQPRDPSTLQPLVQDCGTPEALLHFLGKPVPDWQGAFGADMTFFQNWSVSSVFEYRARNFQIHALDDAFRRSHPLIGRNIREAAEVNATLLNPASTAEERVSAAEIWVRELAGLSPFDGLNEIHDADFIRFRELSLTYRAPVAFAERVGASNLSVTFGGRNLALWTRFPGTDPELDVVGGDRSGDLDANFNLGTVGWGVPIPRRFTFTVRAGF